MTKIISISDNAYEKLRKLKGDQSFSEIIVELTTSQSKDNLLEFAGSLTHEEAKKINKKIYEDRKVSSRRFS